jgi:hypothetical protein
MAATPRYGTMTFQGMETGKTHSVDVYLSDVANALGNWDSGNGAGTASLTYWKAPEKCVLVDFSLASGMADTTNIVLTADGAQIPASRLRYANFLNTLAFRPKLQIGFASGTNVGAIQIA